MSLQMTSPATVAAGQGSKNSSQPADHTKRPLKWQRVLAPILTGAQRAEQAGAATAHRMLNAVLNSANQSEAVGIIQTALNHSFNPDEDPVLAAVAAGFSVRLIAVLERGLKGTGVAR